MYNVYISNKFVKIYSFFILAYPLKECAVVKKFLFTFHLGLNRETQEY